MIKVTEALLYCNKSKPYLYANISALEEPLKLNDKDVFFTTHNTNNFRRNQLNGKIVAECDFEVEKIGTYSKEDIIYLGIKQTQYDVELLEQSCLSNQQMNNYLKLGGGYAIHIKNLHIFDKPKELSEFLYEDDTDGHYGVWTVERAPKNGTVICTDVKDVGGVYCCRGTYGRFLSLSPQELCDVLNGKKTIIIRKTVLKEML